MWERVIRDAVIGKALRSPGVLLRLGVQCGADFLFEDLCRICGGAADERSPPGLHPFAEPLGQPVPRRLLGVPVVFNHPLCGSCLTALDATHRPSRVGVVSGRTVETSSGAVFRWGRDEAGVAGGPGGDEIPLVAPFMTNDNLLKIIHLTKFSGYRELAEPIGRSVAAAARSFTAGGGDVVVPVPADRSRRRADHALEIARAAAAELAIPLAASNLAKVARTRRQSRLEHEERADNVRGAFEVVTDGVAGRNVLLVDDLVTTGATAAACAAALLAAGASRVAVSCFGRAL